MIGSTITHYKITARIGEGGMGEVYRATDSRLNRDVAIKLLPAAVAGDPMRLSRLKREAQVLAALTHGNIAQVYGFEEQAGQHAIVLELVEGEDLAERLARGPLPIEDTRDIALQIAEALEAAHEKGIVHRDLKPANVKLAPDGTVKVLDFGLAKALADDPGEADPASSPTMTAAATQAGIILGTASYMAPEQAKGKPVDRRADVWAFGCVLYEMLSGRRPFDGESVSEVLAHVITQEPDFSALPDDVPKSLTGLVERCLRKDPRKRVPDIAVARIALQELNEDGRGATGIAVTPPPRSTTRAFWLPGVVGLVLGLALAWLASSDEVATPTATHFDLLLDPPHVAGEIALSADGDLLVYTGLVDGARRLFQRRLDGHTSEVIPGTEGGYHPFFSPDQRHVGFFAFGQLKRVSLAGGVVETISPASGQACGAVWEPGDTILFSTVMQPPHRVDARGGEATPLPIAGGGSGHAFHSPVLLPGGRKLLLTRRNASWNDPEIVALDAAGGEPVPVLAGSDARFVAPDRLVFVQNGRVMETAFDPAAGKASGEVRAIDLHDPGTQQNRRAARFHMASSADGTLVYPSGTTSPLLELHRVDEDGKATDLGLPTALPKADSTGTRVVTTLEGTLHLLDLTDGTDLPLTFSRTGAIPLWSPDDAMIVFADDRNGDGYEPFRVASDGSGAAERWFEGPVPTTIPTSIARDGTVMGYGVHPVTNRDVWIRDPDGAVRMLLDSPANERSPAIAPVARLFAYVSNEEGDDQIYLRDVDAPERRWRVSSDGGSSPEWSRDGHELFFVRGSTILAVEVNTEGGIRVGDERVVFEHERLVPEEFGNRIFDTLPDGDLLVALRRETEVVLRVVLGYETGDER